MQRAQKENRPPTGRELICYTLWRTLVRMAASTHRRSRAYAHTARKARRLTWFSDEPGFSWARAELIWSDGSLRPVYVTVRKAYMAGQGFEAAVHELPGAGNRDDYQDVVGGPPYVILWAQDNISTANRAKGVLADVVSKVWPQAP